MSDIMAIQCPHACNCNRVTCDCDASQAEDCPIAAELAIESPPRTSRCTVCGVCIENGKLGPLRKYCPECLQHHRTDRVRYGGYVYMPDALRARLRECQERDGDERTSHTLRRLIDEALERRGF